MSCETPLTQKLSESGFRITPQRRVILHTLLSAQQHLTPAEVLEEARRELPDIEETTIYRTLAFLVERGLAQEAHSSTSKAAYEISASPHHHLICRECGEELEIAHDEVENLFAKLTQETGFQFQQNHLSFFGICPACQKNPESSLAG